MIEELNFKMQTPQNGSSHPFNDRHNYIECDVINKWSDFQNKSRSDKLSSLTFPTFEEKSAIILRTY